MNILIDHCIILKVFKHSLFLEFGLDVLFILFEMLVDFVYGFGTELFVELFNVDFTAGVEDLSDVSEFSLRWWLVMLVEILVLEEVKLLVVLVEQRLWSSDVVEGQISHLICYVSSSELLTFHSLLQLLVAKLREFPFYLTFLIFESLPDSREDFPFVDNYWFGHSY